MATIGSLTADFITNVGIFAGDMRRAAKAVTSNSARINRALARVQRSFRRTTRSMARMARKAVGMRSVIGTLAGTAGFGFLVKRSIDAADSIVKTADKVGLLTDELQELRFAAKQTGVEQRTFDLAIQRFSRRVGEAVQGTGELKDTLIDYNIPLRDATGRTRRLIDILFDYADAVAGAESEQEQLRLSFKGFDSEGAALVNTLRGGADGLRELARQAPKAFRDKLLRGAVRAKDQLTLLGQSIDREVTGAVIRLAPQIESLSRSLLDGLPTLVSWVEQFAEWIGLIDRAPDRIAEIQAEIKKVNDALGLAGGRVTEQARKAVQSRIEGLERELELQREINRARALSNLPPPIIGVPPPAPSGVGTALGGPPIPGRKPENELAALVERLKTIEDQAKEVFDATRTPQERFAARMVMLNDLVEKGAILQDTYGRAVALAQADLAEATETTDQLTKAVGELAADALQGQIRSWKDLANVALNALGAILRKQIEVNAAAGGENGTGGSLLRQIASGVLSLFGGGGQFEGGSGPAPGSFRAAQTIPARQFGGPVFGGQPTLVGEGGPEIFVPPGIGRIEPIAVGPSNVFQVDMRGASVEAVARLERLVAQVNGSIENRAVAAVDDRARRGGRFTKSLRG